MTHSLLYKSEPSAVVSERESGVSPFVFLCDHSGRRIPARLNDLNISQDDLTRHIAWDIGIESVGRELSSHFDACLIMQPYSRLVIDCNRRPGTETSILAVSDGTKIPGNQQLSAEDVAMRVREIFDPYHRKISSHLDGRRDAGRPTISSPCTALRHFMRISRVRGTRACSTTVILTCRSRCSSC